GTVLDVWKQDVKMLSDTVELIDVVVTKDEGGYAISAVNKDGENMQTLVLSMIGDEKKEMRIHTVNGPEKDSYNDIGKTDVSITSTDWMPYREEISLEPHSVNVIEIR
ncbi:MAG: alpha-N-arabinofuranosidase, partial [Clostridia bacterium]|nr:alpha-N-arabinofuranosidase [Clostridia bacterium]